MKKMTSLDEFKNALKILTDNHKKEVGELCTHYRESNLILSIGETIKVETKFLKSFLVNGKNIVKNRSPITILKCTQISPYKDYKTDQLTESAYRLEFLTKKGIVQKHSLPLHVETYVLRKILENALTEEKSEEKPVEWFSPNIPLPEEIDDYFDEDDSYRDFSIAFDTDGGGIIGVYIWNQQKTILETAYTEDHRRYQDENWHIKQAKLRINQIYDNPDQLILKI